MGAGVVPKPKHYGYGTTPRDIALVALYRCPPDSGGQLAEFETSRVLRVFKTAPILDSDYSAIVDMDRCAWPGGVAHHLMGAGVVVPTRNFPVRKHQCVPAAARWK